MLSKESSAPQDFQQTHAYTELFMHAKHEIHHIITQQTRSFKNKYNYAATRHL